MSPTCAFVLLHTSSKAKVNLGEKKQMIPPTCIPPTFYKSIIQKRTTETAVISNVTYIKTRQSDEYADHHISGMVIYEIGNIPV